MARTLTDTTTVVWSDSNPGATEASVPDDAITYAKIQNVSATDKLLGRSSSGAGNVEEIACTAAGRAILDDADAAAQRNTLGVGTGDSPQFTAVNVGHATDTTLSRVSAGVVAVEGKTLANLTDGGTFAADISVPDEAYDATAWNGSLEVPTKNAIRDKIESMGGGGGGGATTALDNLASVAINTSLLSDTDNTDDLGSASKRWKDLFLSGAVKDGNGNELLKLGSTASAVNELTATNAATGNPPVLSSTGDDTNIDIRLTPKGSGVVEIRQLTPALKFYNTTGSFLALQITNSAITAQGSQDLSLSGNGSNINLTDTNSAGTVHFTTNVRAAYNATSPAEIGANQNDYAGWSGAGKAVNMRASSDASRNVTGAAAGANGEFHYIWNVGSFDIVIKHQDAASSAANRFLCTSGADITITPNKTAYMMYDSTTQRWRVTLLP